MTKNNYICSLTTIPSKFDTLYRSIDSLLKQTLMPDKIIVSIPTQYSFRFENAEISAEKIQLLKEKYSNTCVYIHTIDTDHGPGTKLLGVLEFISQCKYIILVDDDVVYKPYMIEYFDKYIESNTNVVSASYCVYCVDIRNIHMGQGVDGFLIRCDILNDFMEYYTKIKDNNYVRYHDDFFISYYLYLKNIYLHPVTSPFNTPIYEVTDSCKVDALSRLEGTYSRGELNVKLYEIFAEFTRQGIFDFMRGA